MFDRVYGASGVEVMFPQLTDELLQEFIKTYPNCPDPQHEPKQVKALMFSFLHSKGVL